MVVYHSDSFRVVEKPPRPLLIIFSFFIAIALNLFPYEDSLFVYKPDFVALLLAYWCMVQPRWIGFTAAFSLGLLMDLAYTAALGQHVLAYAVLVLAAQFMRSRFVLLGLWQQAMNIAFILVVSLLVLFAVSHFVDGSSSLHWRHLTPAAIGAALWLALPIFINFLRQKTGFTS